MLRHILSISGVCKNSQLPPFFFFKLDTKQLKISFECSAFTAHLSCVECCVRDCDLQYIDVTLHVIFQVEEDSSRNEDDD